MSQVNQERFDAIYDDLVDETENPKVYNNRGYSQFLHEILALFEYLMNNEDENPADGWTVSICKRHPERSVVARHRAHCHAVSHGNPETPRCRAA